MEHFGSWCGQCQYTVHKQHRRHLDRVLHGSLAGRNKGVQRLQLERRHSGHSNLCY